MKKVANAKKESEIKQVLMKQLESMSAEQLAALLEQAKSANSTNWLITLTTMYTYYSLYTSYTA